MARIQRRRRVACRLKCEIAIPGNRRRVRGRVVSLSEGGLAIVADIALDQGDPIRILIEPGAGRRPVKVSAIVWNDHSPSPTGRATSIRKLGCVISHPPRIFIKLIDQLDSGCIESRPAKFKPAPIPLARPQAADPKKPDPDLPRSRELQPPLKVEPDETLPYFRVRLKQIGGPRTRILTLRARSATQAERLALNELEKVCSDAAGWGVLHIARVSGYSDS